MGLFGVSRSSQGKQRSDQVSPAEAAPLADGQQLSKDDLAAAIRDVEAIIDQWDATRIVLVKPLQDAARNHGQVQLMKDTKENRMMAVKRMPNRWVRHGSADFAAHYPTASEQPWHDLGYLQHLSTVKFAYVCDIYGVYRSDTETFIATTFCSEGDLFGWCDHPSVPPPGSAREVCIKPIAAQIFAGVRWLHDLGISHRDLSLENILLDGGVGPEANVKIIDFGMSTIQRFVTNEIRGKNSYQAPESHINGEPVDTFLADAFSLGVVLFAMSAHDYPWTCTKRGTCQLFEYVSVNSFRQFLDKRKVRKSKKGEVLSDVLTPAFVDIIDTLVQFDPKKRACCGEACFQGEVKQKKRRSAWEMDFFAGWLTKVPQVPLGGAGGSSVIGHTTE